MTYNIGPQRATPSSVAKITAECKQRFAGVRTLVACRRCGRGIAPSDRCCPFCEADQIDEELA